LNIYVQTVLNFFIESLMIITPCKSPNFLSYLFNIFIDLLLKLLVYYIAFIS